MWSRKTSRRMKGGPAGRSGDDGLSMPVLMEKQELRVYGRAARRADHQRVSLVARSMGDPSGGKTLAGGVNQVSGKSRWLPALCSVG